MTYSSVDAHEKSGVVKRGIQTLIHSTITRILDQVILWPEQSDMKLWAFAIEHTVYM